MSNLKHSNNQLSPPIILVQTWCLLSRDKDKEVSQHAIKMLLDTFGDLRSAVEFVKKNHIRVN